MHTHNITKFLFEQDDSFMLAPRFCDPQVDTVAHKHSFVELVIVMNGSGIHKAGDLEQRLERGIVMVIPRNCAHNYYDTSPDLTLLNILFHPEQLPMPRLGIDFMPSFSEVFTGISGNGDPYVHFKIDDENVNFIIDTAMEFKKEGETHPQNRFTILGLFMTLLGKLTEIASRHAAKKKKYFNSINSVMNFLNLNYKKQIAVEELCRIANMSEATLIRNFRKSTGTTPLQYQISLRIAEAARLLQTTELAVFEIAELSGFSDINYFRRQFIRFTGKKPFQFRKNANAVKTVKQYS